MNSNLSKHIPHHIVELKDGSHYYIESSDLKRFASACNKDKLVSIGDVVIGTYEIRKIYPDEQNTADVLKQYSADIRTQVQNRASEYRSQCGKLPTSQLLLKWAIKFSKQND